MVEQTSVKSGQSVEYTFPQNRSSIEMASVTHVACERRRIFGETKWQPEIRLRSHADRLDFRPSWLTGAVYI